MKQKDSKPRDVDEYILALPETQGAIVKTLREIVLSTSNELNEAIKWRVPTYFLKGNICSIMAHKNHVNLQIFSGAELIDKHSVLEGTGKGMRHLEYRSVDDIRSEIIKDFIEQAIQLDN